MRKGGPILERSEWRCEKAHKEKAPDELALEQGAETNYSTTAYTEERGKVNDEM